MGTATSLPRQRTELVAIGASAGGVAALTALLTPLPTGYALPIVAVLHLLPRHESQLATVLDRASRLPVREAQHNEAIQAGTIYLASPDYHLLVEPERLLSFSSEPPVGFARPSIDLLMTSAADAYGPALVGILLTGANADGAEGMAAIKAAGGFTVVQAPGDAEVATMPAAAIARSEPDLVLPLPAIVQWLQALGSVGGTA